jgi:hypothetical protein
VLVTFNYASAIFIAATAAVAAADNVGEKVKL